MNSDNVSYDFYIPGIRYNIFKSIMGTGGGAVLHKKTPYFESSIIDEKELNDMVCLLDFFGFDSKTLTMTLINTK